MLVTEFKIVSDDNFRQPPNALNSILVIELGIVRDDRLLQL